MKKMIIFVMSILILALSFKSVMASNNKDVQQDIAQKIIRFHVIANSDSEKDQNLKLKIKNEVIQYIQPKLKDCRSIKESRKVLINNDKNMIRLAENIIKDQGYNYKIKSTLSKENFPIKTYGNITLPQGNYEAYRIIIGSGEGHNWWCVMFPPLCFVDVTKGEVSYKQTEQQMKRVLSNNEYKSIDNTSEEKIILKFKIVDIIKSLHLQ